MALHVGFIKSLKQWERQDQENLVSSRHIRPGKIFQTKQQEIQGSKRKYQVAERNIRKPLKVPGSNRICNMEYQGAIGNNREQQGVTGNTRK